jgi:Immunity protein 49
MITQIPFHEYDVELCREILDDQTKRVQKDLMHIGRPDKPGLTLDLVFRSAINYAGSLSQFRPCSYDLCNALRLAAWALEGSFRLARHPKGEQRLEIFLPPAEPLMMTTTGPLSVTNTGNWIRAFHLAMINREKGILDSLCLYPTELLREASKHGVQSAEFSYDYVDMLKAFWRDDPNIQNIANETLRVAIDINTLDEDYIDYALNIASYGISLFIRAHMEQEDFTKQLVEAVERHKKHFFIGKDKLLEDSRYFLALGPIAMSVLALERGLSIEVESDYIPRCIIENKFQEHPDDVICEAWAARPVGSAPSAPLNDSPPASSPQNPRIKQEIEISLESLPPEAQEKFSKLGAELAESQRQLDELEQSIRQSQ